MNWLDSLLTRLAQLWPFAVVKPWQRAVRVTFVPFRGVRVNVLGPGIVRALWFFDSLDIRDVQEDTFNCPSQSVTTQDDVAVTLSANFVYEIEDVEAAVLNVRQFDASLQDLAMVHLAERIREWTWPELLAGQKELERSLKGTLTTRAKDWGVQIVRVGLTDLVKTRQFRHFGDPLLSAS